MPKVTDTLADNVLDKVQTATSRAGHLVQRAAKLRRGNVNAEVIAMQMTKNSPNGHVYTADGVQQMANAYQDSQSKPILTARQTTALLADQAEVRRAGGAGLAPQPA
ncbi:hypothetical protein VH569_28070 [Azospirillum sp. 11R-A]|uniref:hypothetical protein n=1 Tax=Azospirillum sp. 11R-A TaxID=3111634 RepID=UPI003C1C350A